MHRESTRSTMRIYANILLVGLAVFLLAEAAEGVSKKMRDLYPVNQEESQRERYTSSWAVEIAEGGDKMADKMAGRHGFTNLGKQIDGVYHFELQGLEKSRLRTDSPYTAKSNALLSEPCVGFAEQQVIRPRARKSYTVPTDPLFQSQWNLLNSGQYGHEFAKNDLNVERAWLQGLTGCNVTVGVVDDGLEYFHRDLFDNYAAQVSYDFVGNDRDPSDQFPWHGTSCGGIIAALKNGHTCGVGIAYNSNLAGLALLGATTDLNEERSLSYENNVIDIYSNSWGPFDSGTIVDRPGRLAKMALRNGVENGRGGKGSLFVWANGNGGVVDDCAADGYASSIYTISVGAIGVNGAPSNFDEQCSAKMVVTYVTNPEGFSAVSTTALHGRCTPSFGGTSAATPMASGIIALALEANPELTWRDIQYLIVYTSNFALTDSINYTSTTNGAGLQVSRYFGFGVMDAEAMVTRARHWTNVPAQIEQNISPTATSGRATFSSSFTANIEYDGSIQYLEHIIMNMTVETSSTCSDCSRGDIRIELISPLGTASTLLGHRDRDMANGGYYEWPFMSVTFWGEDPAGEWNLAVISRNIKTEIEIRDVKFQLFGTSHVPESVASIPKECHPDCTRGCAAEGSNFCDACVNLRNAYTLECIDSCPPGYSERNGYCYDQAQTVEQCISPLKTKQKGSCVDAGFTECCVDEECEIVSTDFPVACYCDAVCYKFGDCCDDIAQTTCSPGNSTEPTIPYIVLGSTDGVETHSLRSIDDGVSSPIDTSFPLGVQLQTRVYVGTNGYFTFDGQYTGYTPFLFSNFTNQMLVAPFFTDIDISTGVGEIRYEIHTTDSSQSLISSIDSVVSDYIQTDFHGEWLLIAEWKNVPEFGGALDITNTFQGVLTTDFTRSFAVFTYKCGDLSFSGRATVGFTAGDILFANHIVSVRNNAQAIACFNSPKNPWVNVVYELTISMNECEVSNGGCEHICTDTFTSFQCSCRDGYSLNNDQLTCSDVNECASTGHGCDDICVNTIGSFTCECGRGATLDDNGKTCSVNCGGRLTEESGSFHTPGWPYSYPSLNFSCEWMIDIENVTDSLIDISFNEKYGVHGGHQCRTDYVQVWNGISQDASSLGRFCSLDAPEPILIPSTKARIIFQASSLRHLPSAIGVSITYRAVPPVNECDVDNGGCAHTCTDTLLSYTCSCNDGYILDEDDKECIDFDECTSTGHGCEDICVNSHGSYTCSCSDGFVLDDNGKTCSVSCGGTLTGESGSFHTPGWPYSYPSLNFRCEWVIDIENVTDALIDISFDGKYGIHGRDPCRTDYVQVWNGVGQNASSLGKFCFLRTPEPILIHSKKAKIIFQASTFHHLSSRVGASITYKAVPQVNECDVGNGGCAHTCTDTLLSYTCSCKDGYILNGDGKECIDINECASTSHGCEDICVNSNGSYACSCSDGYALDDNGKNCSFSCGGTLTGPSGYFQTPGWPSGYPQLDFICDWTMTNISVQQVVRFEVDRSAYGINGRPPCRQDHLEFFKGLGSDAMSLGRFCKLEVPDPITVSTDAVRIVFEGRINRRRPSSRNGVKVFYELLNSEETS